MYRYNRKGFLEDDDSSDDSFFIVDPRWDDYCLQELKMNRPVPCCPEARRARIKVQREAAALGSREKGESRKLKLEISVEAFTMHINFKVIRCAVIASPGFTKDQFHRQLMLVAERRDIRNIIENKSRIIIVHTTSEYNTGTAHGNCYNTSILPTRIDSQKEPKEPYKILLVPIFSRVPFQDALWS
ncbi:protein PELOTA 1 [Tanacetum coccineum]